jgi:Fe-S-cluster containining protein
MGKLQTEVLELQAKIEKDSTRRLRENRTFTFAVRLAEYAQKEVDRVREDAVNRGVQFDCRKGCGHCCRVLRVEAYPQESFRIARALRERPDQAALVATLAEHVQANRTVTTNNGQHKACPFLVDDACSIYAVRPFMCRKLSSLDFKQCLQGENVPIDPELFYKAEAIQRGTQKAYERVKLPCEPRELIASILLALTDASAEERWWKGEDVFA